MTASVRVVRPLDGELPGAPSVRTAKTGHQIAVAVPRPAESPFRARYPWGELLVDESFFIPTAKKTRMTSIYAAQRKLPGRKFADHWFAVDPVEKVPGIRVWRVR